MLDPKIVISGEIAILNEITGAGMLLDDAVLHLFQNDVVPTKQTVIGDLTEATFDGYTTETIADTEWSAAFVDTDGRTKVVGPLKVWIPSGTTTPNTIYGWYITLAGGALFMATRLNEPVVLDDTSSGLTVVAEVPYGA